MVILSTHIVEDVSDLCSRMAIISRGRVLASGTPQEAIERLRGRVWRKVVGREELSAWEASHNVILSRLSAGARLIHVLANDRPDTGFSEVDPALEDVYFSALGDADREAA